MRPGVVLLILLVLLLIGGFPTWGAHSLGWGPSGVVGALIAVILILLLLGHL